MSVACATCTEPINEVTPYLRVHDGLVHAACVRGGASRIPQATSGLLGAQLLVPGPNGGAEAMLDLEVPPREKVLLGSWRPSGPAEIRRNVADVMGGEPSVTHAKPKEMQPSPIGPADGDAGPPGAFASGNGPSEGSALSGVAHRARTLSLQQLIASVAASGFDTPILLVPVPVEPAEPK